MSHHKPRQSSLDPDLGTSSASSPSHSAGDGPSLLKSSTQKKRTLKKRVSRSADDSEDSGSQTPGYASSLEPPSTLKASKRDTVEEMETLLESPKSSSDSVKDSPKPLRKTKSPKPQPSSDKIVTTKKKSPRSSSVDGRRKLKKSQEADGSGSSNSLASSAAVEFRRTRNADSQSEDDSTSDSNATGTSANLRPCSPLSSSSLDSTASASSSHNNSFKKNRDKISTSTNGDHSEIPVIKHSITEKSSGGPRITKSKSGGGRTEPLLVPTGASLMAKNSSSALSKSGSTSESMQEATSSSEQMSPRSEKSRQATASLLMDVLRSPDHVKLLREHMESGRCDENLDFWMSVEALKFRLEYLSARQGGVPLDPKLILREGNDIYQTFIDAKATRPLNLPAKISAKLRHGFRAENPSFAITDGLFDEAQNCSFKVIECDPFPRFLASAGPNATSGLLHLGNHLPDAEFDEFHSFLDANPSVPTANSSKTKWSKVSEDDGVRILRMESHGQVTLKATMELSGSVKSIGVFIAQHQFWASWYRPGSTYIELETLGPHLDVIYMQVPGSKDSFKDVILAVGTKHEVGMTTILFKSIPHASAPTPEDTSRSTILLSGWKVVSSETSPNAVHITYILRAGKSDSKRWEKEAAAQHTAMVQLRKVTSPPPPRGAGSTSS